MKPLHPDKPRPPIVAGDVWIKKASGKTSVNAPLADILAYLGSEGWRSRRVVYRVRGQTATRRVTEHTFRRDWRPC
jgi:hypothetical protein